MDIIEQARSILRQTDISWLELDLKFDVDVWKQQILAIEQDYTEYRESSSHLWSSCCLHGIDIDKTYTADNYGYSEFDAPYHYTDLAYKTPVITNFWKNDFPAERYTRIRFMKVDAGGHIDYHNDGTLPDGIDPLDSILPINLAIRHPNNCTMELDGKIVPWAEGKIFLLNISKDHAVFNRSSKPRVHMIANIILGKRKQEFCEMLVRCYNKQHGQI
jgi:Aspartyl/Asparaginyl beta-hydroxylase